MADLGVHSHPLNIVPIRIFLFGDLLLTCQMFVPGLWIWEEPHTVAGQLLWWHSSLAVSWLVSARRMHVLI